MNKFALAFLVSAIYAGPLSAQDGPIRLTTDKPVYRAGQPGWVQIKATNVGSQPLQLPGTQPWIVVRMSNPTQLIYAPANASSVSTLMPGQSRTWWWNKKKYNGMWAAADSYRIVVGNFSGAGIPQFTVSLQIALTPSGNLAGTGPFPLAVGNRWDYRTEPLPQWPSGKAESMEVFYKSGSWYWVEKLAGRGYWAALTGTTTQTLYGTTSSTQPYAPLFRFGRPLGYTYTTAALPFQKVKVGALNELVTTPAGKFSGCYRLDVLESSEEFRMFQSFWFAPGAGLVQWSETWWGATNLQETSVTFRLRRATVQGADGKAYTIGVNP